MCECGCISNDDRYTFPGPGKSFYVLTLSGHCRNCDAPSGVSIELIEPGNILYKEYKRGDFTNGPLKFEKWPDSKGVAIICGFRSYGFIHSLLPHLIGVDSREMGENGKTIDEDGADAILGEMYEDAQFRPALVTATKAAEKGGE